MTKKSMRIGHLGDEDTQRVRECFSVLGLYVVLYAVLRSDRRSGEGHRLSKVWTKKCPKPKQVFAVSLGLTHFNLVVWLTKLVRHCFLSGFSFQTPIWDIFSNSDML